MTHHTRRGTSLGVHPMGIGDGRMEDTVTLVVPEGGRLYQDKVLLSVIKTITVRICGGSVDMLERRGREEMVVSTPSYMVQDNNPNSVLMLDA